MGKQLHPTPSVGDKFGKLTVVELVGPIPVGQRRSAGARFRCDCGTLVTEVITRVRSGHRHSCGCLSGVDRMGGRKRTGLSRRSEYGIWAAMRWRCNEPSAVSFTRYGGRGIAVCDRWSGEGGFANFLADMGARPSKYHSIDRINNDGNYEPGNCRWATRSDQNANRELKGAGKGIPKGPVVITHNGESHCIIEWSRRLGLSRKVIAYRLKKGLPADEILRV